MSFAVHRTGSVSESHVDHDNDSISPDHPVYEIRQALLDGTVSIHEARIAFAISTSEEAQGLRGIERASGLCDDTVLDIIPQTGMSTTLLHCTDRGLYAYEVEDRRIMEIKVRRYRSPVDHPRYLSCTSTTKDQETKLYIDHPPSLFLDSCVEVREETRGDRLLTGITRDALRLLDPKLDMWSNRKGQLGDAGWALAVVTGMQPTDFSLDALETLLGLKERQVRRLLKRMDEEGLIRRTKIGRRVVVTVDMSVWTWEDEIEEYANRTQHHARKSVIHQWEAKSAELVKTELGRKAREWWQHRKGFADMLRVIADELGGPLDHSLLRILDRAGSKGYGRWFVERDLRAHWGAA